MYRFKSKADADLFMTAPVGDQILRIVGKEPGAQGIIERDQLPAAMAALEVAIAGAEANRRAHPGEAEDTDGAIAVGLAQRAWPMLEMMRRSHAEQADIVWGV